MYVKWVSSLRGPLPAPWIIMYRPVIVFPAACRRPVSQYNVDNGHLCYSKYCSERSFHFVSARLSSARASKECSLRSAIFIVIVIVIITIDVKLSLLMYAKRNASAQRRKITRMINGHCRAMRVHNYIFARCKKIFTYRSFCPLQTKQ